MNSLNLKLYLIVLTLFILLFTLLPTPLNGDPVKKKVVAVKKIVAIKKLPVLILKKLLGIKKKILLAKPIAIGALVLGSGAGIGWAQLEASKYYFETVKRLFKKFIPHVLPAAHFHSPMGWVRKIYNHHRMRKVRRWPYISVLRHHRTRTRHVHVYDQGHGHDLGHGYGHNNYHGHENGQGNDYGQGQDYGHGQNQGHGHGHGHDQGHGYGQDSDNGRYGNYDSRFRFWKDERDLFDNNDDWWTSWSPSTLASNIVEQKIDPKTTVNPKIMKESQEYLQQHFEKYLANATTSDKDMADLLENLKEASQTETVQLPDPEVKAKYEPEELEDLETSESKKKIILRKTQNSGTKSEWQPPKTFMTEIQQFFVILSTFDKDSCIEKLLCDIHATGVHKNAKTLSYETKVVSLFKVLLTSPGLDKISRKYVTAAKYGKDTLSSKWCHQKYSKCKYTKTQLIRMGEDLENSSTVSVNKNI